MALHSGHRCVCASRMHLWISLSIAVSAPTPVRIDKLCGRTNSEVAGKTHRSARLPLPTPPLWLTSLFVGYTRTVERRGFVFCSGKILTYIARRGSTSFRRGTIGSASPSGKLDPWAGGREVRIGSAFRLNVRRQVYLSRYWDRFSDFGFGFSMLGFNLVGIWLTSNDDLFSFFFFLNIEALFIERIKFVIFVSKMQFLRLMV